MFLPRFFHSLFFVIWLSLPYFCVSETETQCNELKANLPQASFPSPSIVPPSSYDPNTFDYTGNYCCGWNLVSAGNSFISITCSNNYIVRLNLAGPVKLLNLSLFSNLTKLQIRSVSTKALTFYTDNDLSALGSLTNLAVTFSGLMGSIPSFTNNNLLTDIDLSTNALTGTIPNMNNLKALSSLSLYNNFLSGSIPSFTYNPNLSLFDVTYNSLTGSLPSFDNNPLLGFLEFGGNKITGTVPSFSKNVNLRSLLAVNCSLQGSIPTFSNNPYLSFIQLGGNSFTSINPLFPSYTLNIINLDISNNPLLTGPYPNLMNLTQLSTLFIKKTSLTGPLIAPSCDPHNIQSDTLITSCPPSPTQTCLPGFAMDKTGLCTIIATPSPSASPSTSPNLPGEANSIAVSMSPFLCFFGLVLFNIVASL